MSIHVLVQILFICDLFVLDALGQSIEFQPSLEIQRFHNSSKNFSWKNCDDTSRALNFTVVDMRPDPLLLTGENLSMTVSLGFDLTTELGANGDEIEVDLSIRLKIPDGYMEICSIVGESICHYNNLCTRLGKLTKDCKKYGLDWCECPFKAKSYLVPPLQIPIEPIPFLLKGTFEVTVFVKQQGKHVGCLDIHFCVTECMF